MADNNCGQTTIIPDNNQVSLQDVNQTITVTDNNCCTVVDVAQPITQVIQVLTGPIGATGAAGTLPTSGSLNLSGSINVTGDISANNFIGGTFSGSFTGSLEGTASYALSSSYSLTASYASNIPATASYALNALSSSYASTSSYLNTLSQDLTVNGNLILNGTASIAYLTVTYESASVIYSSGSNQLGDAVNDVQILVGRTKISGSLEVTGSTNIPSITGSLLGTSSYALNAATASNILGGKATHIPYFITDTTLATSSLYQSGSTSIIINQDANTLDNPEALYVWQPHPTSINVISGKGNINNYLQLNIQNTNQGVSASSDVVATANNGTEFDKFIDMGINSQNYIDNGNGLGQSNDAYLYSTGNNLLIGNITPSKSVFIFNGANQNKITLDPTGNVLINGNTNLTGSLFVNQGITGSLLGTASYTNQALSSSYALTASYASNIPATASYSLQSLSSSFASTASYVKNAQTASYIVSSSYALTASYVANASSFPYTGSAIITGSLVITGSVTSTNGFTGSLLGTASYSNQALSSSFATTSSYLLGTVTSASFASTASYIPTLKSLSGSVASFAGTPYSASITFGTAYVNNLYGVSVIGEDLRAWSISGKTSTGFTINTNSSVALSGPVYWITTPFNS